MQPAAAIPPLVKAEVKTLIGQECWIPRNEDPYKLWRVTIIGVRRVGQTAAIVTIDRSRGLTRTKKWRGPRSVLLSSLRFDGHTDDPLLIAMIKANATSSSHTALQS